jgi:chromosome segregation ATPase
VSPVGEVEGTLSQPVAARVAELETEIGVEDEPEAMGESEVIQGPESGPNIGSLELEKPLEAPRSDTILSPREERLLDLEMRYLHTDLVLFREELTKLTGNVITLQGLVARFEQAERSNRLQVIETAQAQTRVEETRRGLAQEVEALREELEEARREVWRIEVEDRLREDVARLAELEARLSALRVQAWDAATVAGVQQVRREMEALGVEERIREIQSRIEAAGERMQAQLRTLR